MEYTLSPISSGLFMAVLVLAAIELGRGMAARRQHKGLPLQKIGAAESVVLAILGLMISFTFSGAANRFEARRELIGLETNAVTSGWLRLDMLNSEDQPAVRRQFLSYLDARLAAYAAFPDVEAVRDNLAKARDLQFDLWRSTVTSANRPDSVSGAAVTVLPAMTTMFDAAMLRTVALEAHPPLVIFVLLYTLAACAGVIIGAQVTQLPERRAFQQWALALLLGLAIFVILELEYPRGGLVTIEDADRFLIELRERIATETP